jgi:hypothetical protein
MLLLMMMMLLAAAPAACPSCLYAGCWTQAQATTESLDPAAALRMLSLRTHVHPLLLFGGRLTHMPASCKSSAGQDHSPSLGLLLQAQLLLLLLLLLPWAAVVNAHLKNMSAFSTSSAVHGRIT